MSSDNSTIRSVRISDEQRAMIDEIVTLDAKLGGVSAGKPRKPGNVLASAVQTGLETILAHVKREIAAQAPTAAKALHPFMVDLHNPKVLDVVAGVIGEHVPGGVDSTRAIGRDVVAALVDAANRGEL